MDKIIIFGCGPTGLRAYKEYSKDHQVIGFMDNDPQKTGTSVCGVNVCRPLKNTLEKLEYDLILIASVDGMWQIRKQLREMGVADEKIRNYTRKQGYDVLLHFLKNLAEDFREDHMEGACAEVGVFRGVCARKINSCFEDRMLHLYDTFEGFAAEDLEAEHEIGRKDAKAGRFCDTSIECVMEGMAHPEKVVIHKGHFPDTADGLTERFCFVRIDLDLYVPTRAALGLFAPLMVPGGIILVHDYYGDAYPGVKKVVGEFMKKHPELRKIPIGDDLTIAITGF